MNLRCSLSTHRAAPAMLANQGFQFSKCLRCGSDLIRSESSSLDAWQTVPAGFRVSWRAADLTRFAHDDAVPRAWRRFLASASAARDAALLVVTIIRWRTVDATRHATQAIREAFASGRRRLRLSHRKDATTPATIGSHMGPGVIIVNFTLGREMRLGEIGALLDTVRPGAIVRA